jgi:hypothetical protein
VRQYDTLYHEELRVANLVKNHRLAKSISDAGGAAFLTNLTFKAASAGQRVVGVNPRSPAKPARGAASSSRKAYPCAGILARTVGPVCIGTTMLRATFCGWGKHTGNHTHKSRVGRDTAFMRQRGPVGRT